MKQRGMAIAQQMRGQGMDMSEQMKQKGMAIAEKMKQKGLDLSWNEPDYHGSPITGYQIERKTNGSWTVIVADTGSTSTTYSDTGLSSDTKYQYRVSAINEIGTGDASISVSETTFGGEGEED